LSVNQAVYYTTNGIAPTTSVRGTVYSQPFIVSTTKGTFTVEAAVYDGGTGLWSSATPATFIVWAINPHVGPITTTETVGIDTVGQTVYYTIASGSTGITPTTVNGTVYSQPFIVSTTAGTFTVDAAVYNNSTGMSNDVDTATFLVNYPSSGGGGGGSSVSYTPAVQTEAATSVTTTSAVLNGDITSDNGYAVTAYGFLWGTSASSLTNTLAVGTNNQSGAFMDTLSGLTDGTTYYFEAYATNSYGTADGSVLSLTAGVQTPTTSTGTVFSDVPPYFWGYSIITSMSTRGIVYGYPDGTFKPNSDITRAEFAVMLVKALGLSITGTTSAFTDVAQGSWLYGSVNAAAAAGLVSGLGNNQFGPYTLITRQEMAVMVAKALGIRTPATVGTELNAFNDGSRVSSWATTGMDEAVKAGIVIGMSADHLAPMAHATRAQAAAMIYQLLNFLGK
jgi:hypothetical protein